MSCTISATQILFVFLVATCGLLYVWNRYSHDYFISKTMTLASDNNRINLKSLNTTEKKTSNVNSTNITADCLLSLTDCLASIGQSGRGHPRLISFSSHTPVAKVMGNASNILVPNIVHLISFGNNQPFVFYNYVAFKSFHKYMKPLAIFLWSDFLPSTSSKWWTHTLKEVPDVYHVYTQPVKEIGGKQIKYVAHSADVFRLQIVKEFGGLYVDNDVIVLRSFDDLRVHPLTLGRTSNDALSNNVMLGERGSQFVSMWLEAYANYKPDNWGANSFNMAHSLAIKFPHLLHIEEKSLNHPTWQYLDELYMKNYNLTNNYSIHMFLKLTRYIPDSLEELDGYNCTVGNAMRMVLYGEPDLRRKHNITVGHHIKEYIREKF